MITIKEAIRNVENEYKDTKAISYIDFKDSYIINTVDSDRVGDPLAIGVGIIVDKKTGKKIGSSNLPWLASLTDEELDYLHNNIIKV